jgi:iron complex outermembrane receptor protein
LYKRTTKDLLLNTSTPSFFGFQTKTITMLEIDNKGIELLAEVIAVRTNDVEWRIGGNVTFQDSKITKLTTVQPNTPGLDVGAISGGTGQFKITSRICAKFILCI